jgi:hypothetical protein
VSVPRSVNRAARIEVWEAMCGLLPPVDGTPEVLDALRRLAVLRVALEDEVLRCVNQAFHEMHTWEAIGVALRCSAQAAHKRYAAKVNAADATASSARTKGESRQRRRQIATGPSRHRRSASPPPEPAARGRGRSTSDEAPPVGSSRVASGDDMRRRAQNLLARGYSVQVVAALTGWPPWVVRELADSDNDDGHEKG